MLFCCAMYSMYSNSVNFSSKRESNTDCPENDCIMDHKIPGYENCNRFAINCFPMIAVSKYR